MIRTVPLLPSVEREVNVVLGYAGGLVPPVNVTGSTPRWYAPDFPERMAGA
jgi:hypothetical protein